MVCFGPAVDEPANSMTYTYTPLGKVAAARSELCQYAARALAIVAALTLVAFCWWLQSDLRQLGASINEASCARVPWYYFPTSEGTLLLNGDEHYLAPINASTSALRGESVIHASSHPKRIVTHVQACSYADAGSAYLRALLENHKTYCRANGIEYILRTGPGDGVWLKIIAAGEKVALELQKRDSERAHWILYV